jgi:hypothetical protein
MGSREIFGERTRVGGLKEGWREAEFAVAEAAGEGEDGLLLSKVFRKAGDWSWSVLRELTSEGSSSWLWPWSWEGSTAATLGRGACVAVGRNMAQKRKGEGGWICRVQNIELQLLCLCCERERERRAIPLGRREGGRGSTLTDTDTRSLCSYLENSLWTGGGGEGSVQQIERGNG